MLDIELGVHKHIPGIRQILHAFGTCLRRAAVHSLIAPNEY